MIALRSCSRSNPGQWRVTGSFPGVSGPQSCSMPDLVGARTEKQGRWGLWHQPQAPARGQAEVQRHPESGTGLASTCSLTLAGRPLPTVQHTPLGLVQLAMLPTGAGPSCSAPDGSLGALDAQWTGVWPQDTCHLLKGSCDLGHLILTCCYCTHNHTGACSWAWPALRLPSVCSSPQALGAVLGELLLHRLGSDCCLEVPKAEREECGAHCDWSAPGAMAVGPVRGTGLTPAIGPFSCGPRALVS